MSEIIDFLKMTPDLVIGKEQFYNIFRFLDENKSKSYHFDEMEELYLDPFYIKNGVMYELEYYQFRLVAKNGMDTNSYILAISRKITLSEVDNKLIDVLNHSYFTCAETLLKDISDWMNYVINNPDLISVIKEVYGYYDPKNMYFDIFAM